MPDEITQVLLIEQEPILADITQFRLELLGYEVVWFSAGSEALQWLSRNLPDVIVLAQLLPDMAGTELLNKLSNDERMSQVPVMILSSNSDLDDVQKAYHAGATDYLVTPYDPQVLANKIGQLANLPQV